MQILVKAIKFFLVFILPGVVLFAGYQAYQYYQYDKSIHENIGQLPAFELYDIEHNRVDWEKKIPKVILGFHPKCDYCIKEAEAIGANSIENVQFIWITHDALAPTKAFKNTYLQGEEHVVCVDTLFRFEKYYPAPINPCGYIYNENNQLLDYFHGKTEASFIKTSLE